ncbi:MAG TPA: hypothetical protein VMW42_02740 [Desulfatiglandales bacterium]|nr:hypothetical protein [Desulfatiglandales bacterium]
MAVLLITYDLNNPDQDYSGFHDAIKCYGSWADLSESSYAVETDVKPTAIRDKLKEHIGKKDQVYIFTLTAPCAGMGSLEVKRWLSKRL